MPTAHSLSAQQIKNALLQATTTDLDPLDELIATGEAVFNLIRFSELDEGVKNAFYQLEKQFEMYAKLAVKEI